MGKNFSKDFLFQRMLFPGVINGSRFDWEDKETPLVGIKGFGTEHKRNKKKSIWINGIILSPNITRNDYCASRSYIEGIVTYDGMARFLESVSDFPAYEGSCFDYGLRMKIENSLENGLPEFEGEIFKRKAFDKGKPQEWGKVYLNINSAWSNREEGGKAVIHSLPRYNRDRILGDYVPTFWKTFLGEIEEKGFDHPYMAQTEKLQKERKSKEKRVEQKFFIPKTGPEDLPF